MRRSAYKWWGYVKACITDYPHAIRDTETLSESWTCQRRREYDGVRMAIEETKKLPDGEQRINLIRLSYWDKRYTLDGAAIRSHVSIRTAQRWRRAFILLVARHMELLN